MNAKDLKDKKGSDLMYPVKGTLNLTMSTKIGTSITSYSDWMDTVRETSSQSVAGAFPAMNGAPSSAAVQTWLGLSSPTGMYFAFAPSISNMGGTAPKVTLIGFEFTITAENNKTVPAGLQGAFRAYSDLGSLAGAIPATQIPGLKHEFTATASAAANSSIQGEVYSIRPVYEIGSNSITTGDVAFDPATSQSPKIYTVSALDLGINPECDAAMVSFEISGASSFASDFTLSFTPIYVGEASREAGFDLVAGSM